MTPKEIFDAYAAFVTKAVAIAQACDHYVSPSDHHPRLELNGEILSLIWDYDDDEGEHILEFPFNYLDAPDLAVAYIKAQREERKRIAIEKRTADDKRYRQFEYEKLKKEFGE